MPRNKITIRRSWDSATTRFINGNKPVKKGGTPELEWVTSGNFTAGSLITIRSSTPNLFGAPDPRAQSFSMVGDETLVNGVNNPWMAPYAVNELLRGYKNGGSGYADGHTQVGVRVPLDPNSPFSSVVAATKSNFTRHANITSSVKMGAFHGISDSGGEPGVFLWPKPFSPDLNRVTRPGALCVATWTFYDFDNAEEMNRIRYSSITGSFNTGANSTPTISGSSIVGGIVEPGEVVNLVSGTGKVAVGNVVVVDTVNNWIYVTIDRSYDEWFNVSDWMGATITGTVSGATTTIPTYPLWVTGTTYPSGVIVYTSAGNFYTSQQSGNLNNDPALSDQGNAFWVINNNIIRNEGANKNARILQAANVSLVDTATVIAGVSGNIGINVFYGSTNDATNATPLKPTPFQWHRRTIWVDYRPDVNGKIMCGQIIDNNPAQICLIDAHNVRSDIGPILSNWGIEANVHNGHTSISAELKTYTDVLMCVISDSPTWSGVNNLQAEPLIPYGYRTATEATFRVSNGIYSSLVGKYLYMLKNPAEVINTSGLLLE